MGILMHHVLPPMTISQEERTFFAELGERVAQLRKANNITQVQLAEVLEVSQQTIQAYEVGRRRIPVSALPVLAQRLAVSLEELLGHARHGTRKPGPTPKLQQHMERISRLPKAQQRFVMQMLEPVLPQASH